MIENSIIEFVVIGAIVLMFIIFISYTTGKGRENSNNSNLDTIPLATFFSADEAEELRGFISANGFGAMVDIQSLGRSGNKYVVRILGKDRDAVTVIIKEFLERSKEQEQNPKPEAKAEDDNLFNKPPI
ncbi:MAG: hypothetical protein V1701_07880 [Planctomycetota bacterium]